MPVLSCSTLDLIGSLLWHANSYFVAFGIQFPDQAMNLGPPALEAWSLDTGPRRKSPDIFYFHKIRCINYFFYELCFYW